MFDHSTDGLHGSGPDVNNDAQGDNNIDVHNDAGGLHLSEHLLFLMEIMVM